MLQGLEPIIIFSFYKLLPPAESELTKIPGIGQYLNKLRLPPIPIYLSQARTGIHIDTEEKRIDMSTSLESLGDGESILANQKSLASVVTITMMASRGSTGVTLLSALCDFILSRVTAKEYNITYLHGAITIFDGLIHSFSIEQNANEDKYQIQLELTRRAVP